MERLKIILTNLTKNLWLIPWLLAAIFFAFFASTLTNGSPYIILFSLLSAICTGIFVNHYTNMFGTSKTDAALNAIFSTLNDYYYIIRDEQRDLTKEESKTVRELIKVAVILDPKHKGIEIFRKYKKEQVAKKTHHFTLSGSYIGFNSKQLDYSEMVLNSYYDPLNTASTGSADTLVDPEYSQPNTPIAGSSAPPIMPNM